MRKTAIELKERVKELNLKRWDIHTCSLCGYRCGYVFSEDGEQVGYDAGCGCSWNPPQLRDWLDLEEAFNRNQPEENPNFSQNHPEEFKKHYVVWGFEN